MAVTPHASIHTAGSNRFKCHLTPAPELLNAIYIYIVPFGKGLSPKQQRKFMKAREVFPIVLLILCCMRVQGQQFGGHPSSQKWRHIGNDSIDLIYPQSAKDQASAIFSLISKIPATLPAPHRVKRLPVVLQNKTS